MIPIRHTLWILIVAIAACCSVRGAAIPGTIPITAPIAPTDTTDTFPTHAALYGKGGLRTVTDNTARDAIPAARREEGMLVYVQSPSPALFRLGSDLTTWTQLQIPTLTDWVSINGEADLLTASAALSRRLSNEAIPLTLLQSSPRTAIGFSRNSDALDPASGGVSAANQARTIPLAFGGAIGSALLIERQATNKAFNPANETQIYGVRSTVVTSTVAGPFGLPLPVLAWTDTSDMNTHYVYQGPCTNTPSSPVYASVLFKPLISTNLNYIFYLGSETNLTWSLWARASLTNETALPSITYTTNGPMTLHSAGFTPLGNGWWHAYMVATATNVTGVRWGLVPAAFLQYQGVTDRPQFLTAGYHYSPTPDATELPVYPPVRTNLSIIADKRPDAYRFTNAVPWKSTGGTLLLWVRNGMRQPSQATLFQSVPSGALRVRMSPTTLSVEAADQGSGVSISATIPSLAYFGERQIAITWSTTGLKAYVDGSLVGSSSAPTGALLFDPSGQVGASSSDAEAWGGFIGAAYVPRTLTDSEILFTPYVVGPPNP